MAARVVAVLLNAVPNFWLGLILLLFFGSFLDLLPLGKRCLPNLLGVCPPLFARIEFLVLPTIVLAGNNIAVFSRYARTSTLEVMNQDYIRTARSKGLRAALSISDTRSATP